MIDRNNFVGDNKERTMFDLLPHADTTEIAERQRFRQPFCSAPLSETERVDALGSKAGERQWKINLYTTAILPMAPLLAGLLSIRP